MKILIHVRDMKLTKLERAKIERRLTLILARYGTRIDRLKVGFVGPRGSVHARFAIEVRMKPRLVRAEHSDTDLFVAVEHGAQRAARSVARAIAREGWWDETGVIAGPP
jgi:ribosome-associated translation inhibitor RaiA